MDCEAVNMASDTVLIELGLQKQGDILSLRAFFQREMQSSSGDNSGYNKRKSELIEILRQDKSKKSKADTNKKKEKSRKVTVGWMHYSSLVNKYVSVRESKGGGTHRLDFPLSCKKDHIIEEGKKLFFNKDSSHGMDMKDMEFDVTNAQGHIVPNSIDGSPFTLQGYIEKNKLVTIRLYLASKEKTITVIDGTYDSDHKTSISNYISTNQLMAHLDQQSIPIDSHLIGSTNDRGKLKMQQDLEYQQSLDADRYKQKMMVDSKMQEEQEAFQLESLRLAREMRVPPEPDVLSPRVHIAVNHLTKGKIKRFFHLNDKMASVYDWVGSQELRPENFKLSLPGLPIEPFESVFECTLYMSAVDDPVPMSDDPKVTFRGFTFGNTDELFDLEW